MSSVTTRTTALAAALLVSVALAACGSTANAGSEAGASNPATGASSAAAGSALMPPGEGKTQYPLTLKTAWGETTLEKRPQRIATVSPGAQDEEFVISMGVTPVIAPAEPADHIVEGLRGKKIEQEVDMSPDAIPVEAIAKAHPDLIVVTGTDVKEFYDKLSAIAPVVAAPDQASVKATWRDRMTQIGQALDLSDAAKKAIDKRDATIAELRTANPEIQGKTATYAVFYSDGTLRYQTAAGSDVEKLFTDLGFAPNPLAKKYAKVNDLSKEKLGDLDADVLLLSDNSDGKVNAVTGNPLYTALPVVKAGHDVVFLNKDNGYVVNGKRHEGNIAWAMHMPGPLSDAWAARRLVELVKPALAK